MQNNFFNSETPAFAKAEFYNPNASSPSDVYNEIITIAREIEQCRASV